MFTRNNIVHGIVLQLGILLYFSININQVYTPTFIDLTSDKNLPANCIYPDSEIYEEDQNCYQKELISVSFIDLPQSHFQTSFQINFPSYGIWQPPKLR